MCEFVFEPINNEGKALICLNRGLYDMPVVWDVKYTLDQEMRIKNTKKRNNTANCKNFADRS